MTGARHEHGPDRQALRWSREDGFVVVDGQKVPIERRRLRSKKGGEVRLGTYELFQQTRTLDDEAWWKMLRGLTTRNYPLVTRSFAQAYGIEKSATSERFIQASRDKLKELMERPLGELKLCAIVIDGTPFKGRQMMAAIGVGNDGKKTVLGLREGATENATVVRELLEDLARRGLDFTTPRLYVVDGAKALHSAVKRHGGEGRADSALSGPQAPERTGAVAGGVSAGHRAQVGGRLCDGGIRRRSARTGATPQGVGSHQSQCRAESGRRHGRNSHGSQAAGTELLRKSLASTNIIESAFSVAEELCRRVKRWREGDHRERWAGSALLLAESKFRRLKGYREIPKLVTALADYGIKKGLAIKAKTA